MSNPICLIYLRKGDAEMSEFLQQINKLQANLEKKWQDYHVLVIPSSNNNPEDEFIDMQVLNHHKNISKVTFNQLKDMVIKVLEDLDKKDK